MLMEKNLEQKPFSSLECLKSMKYKMVSKHFRLWVDVPLSTPQPLRVVCFAC